MRGRTGSPLCPGAEWIREAVFSSKIRFPLQKLPGLLSPGTLGNVYPELNLFRFASRLVFGGERFCGCATLKRRYMSVFYLKVLLSEPPMRFDDLNRPLWRPHPDHWHCCLAVSLVACPSPSCETTPVLSGSAVVTRSFIRSASSLCRCSGQGCKGAKKKILEAFHEKLGCRVLEIFPTETLSMGIIGILLGSQVI